MPARMREAAVRTEASGATPSSPQNGASVNKGFQVIAAKTTDCATFTAKPLPADTAARLISTVGTLESLPDIAALLRIVT